jgi:hypothetical protein
MYACSARAAQLKPITTTISDWISPPKPAPTLPLLNAYGRTAHTTHTVAKHTEVGGDKYEASKHASKSTHQQYKQTR